MKNKRLLKTLATAFACVMTAAFGGCGVKLAANLPEENEDKIAQTEIIEEIVGTEESRGVMQGDVMTAGETHVISPDTADYTVYLPAEGMAAGVNVLFTIEVKIDLPSWASPTDVYSGAGFYTQTGKWIDDCLPYGITSYITSRAKVIIRDNTPVLPINIKNGNGLTFRISDPVCSPDNLPQEWFGGATLYVMPAKSYDTTCSYVFKSSDGQVIVYDGGNASDYDYLVKFLYTLTSEVDGWILSHFHSDHIGALIKVLQNDAITIDKLVYAFPSLDVCQSHSDGVAIVTEFNNALHSSTCVNQTVTPERGDAFEFGDLTFTALNSMQVIDNNFGNNTTIVYRVDTAGENILLLGDAGEELGDIIAAESATNGITECSVVQTAHHGQHGVKDNFYELVMPKVMLFPTPMWEFWSRIESLVPFDTRFDIIKIRELMRDLCVSEKILASNGLQIIK